MVTKEKYTDPETGLRARPHLLHTFERCTAVRSYYRTTTVAPSVPQTFIICTCHIKSNFGVCWFGRYDERFILILYPYKSYRRSENYSQQVVRLLRLHTTARAAPWGPYGAQGLSDRAYCCVDEQAASRCPQFLVRSHDFAALLVPVVPGIM